MKKYKLNKIKLLRFICLIMVTLMLTTLAIDFIRFPECYITTWKHQLQHDIAAGNEQAIEYYQTNYVQNGRILFK